MHFQVNIFSSLLLAGCVFVYTKIACRLQKQSCPAHAGKKMLPGRILNYKPYLYCSHEKTGSKICLHHHTPVAGR